jgi:hypothetical protein
MVLVLDYGDWIYSTFGCIRLYPNFPSLTGEAVQSIKNTATQRMRLLSLALEIPNKTGSLTLTTDHRSGNTTPMFHLCVLTRETQFTSPNRPTQFLEIHRTPLSILGNNTRRSRSTSRERVGKPVSQVVGAGLGDIGRDTETLD